MAFAGCNAVEEYKFCHLSREKSKLASGVSQAKRERLILGREIAGLLWCREVRAGAAARGYTLHSSEVLLVFNQSYITGGIGENAPACCAAW